ncbi:MAG: LytTR family DNA-binding domain-containing protein [Proteiniphilum sp.]|jgi:DNA-binding LytR/AlgR family response regulator
MKRKINCVIIDDEPPASDILKYYIEKTPNFEVAEIYYDPIKALEGLRSKKVDVIFCDVEMPDINGLQLLESLTLHRNKNTLVVIISAHAKYAIDGFDINAIDYLLKPVSFARFLKSTEKILNYLKDKDSSDISTDIEEQMPLTESSKDYIFIKSKGKLVKIEYVDILYIEAIGDYVKIYLENTKPVVIMDSLKHLEKTLPNDFFRRIHRSYIIPLSRIRAIEYKKVILGENLSLPISNSYYDDLYDSLVSNHIVKTISDR